MYRHSLRLAGLALATACAFQAFAGIVVPNSCASTEGSLNNTIPFYWGEALRYQQVYHANQFGALSGPTNLYAMRFRLNGGQPAFSEGTSVDVRLSTTSKMPDGLDSIFANNTGADVTLVHSGAITLSSAATGSGPLDFDIVVPFSTPFLYDPSGGNLLLEVQLFGATSHSHFFDAEFASGDSVSRLYNLGDAFASEANGSDTLGLVTMFDTVPEPASLAALGLGAVALLRRRRK